MVTYICSIWKTVKEPARANPGEPKPTWQAYIQVQEGERTNMAGTEGTGMAMSDEFVMTREEQMLLKSSGKFSEEE